MRARLGPPKKRVLLLLGVAMVLASGLAAASAHSTSTVAKKRLRIAVILPDFTANELILDQKNGAEAAAKKLGVSLLLSGFGSAEAQVKAGQSAIASKVDAIAYNTTDAKAFTSVVRSANKAHIPIVCDNSCASGGKNAVTITFNYNQMGLLAAKWLAAKLPSGGGTLGIVDGNHTDSTEQQIYNGLYAGLKAAGAHPDVKLSPPTNWDPATALSVSQNFITANPKLDVLICMHDLIANACQQAMNAANYPSIPLSGLGGTCQGFSNMLHGRQQFTVAQFLYRAGYLGVVAAVQVAQGKKPANTNQVAPMVGLSTDDIKAMLAGTKKVPPGLGLLQKLKRAEGGCK